MICTPVRTITGPAGAATLVRTVLEDRDPVDQGATVAAWFLSCPRQSPAWEHYLLKVLHLRPIEGGRPVNLAREGATHEVLLVALDPDRKPVPHDAQTWLHLYPVNAAEQLVLPHDGAARVAVEIAAQLVMHGVLPAEPPLSGAVEPWHSVLRTIETLFDPGGPYRPGRFYSTS